MHEFQVQSGNSHMTNTPAFEGSYTPLKRLMSESPCSVCGKALYIGSSKMYCVGCDRPAKSCVCPTLLSQTREYR